MGLERSKAAPSLPGGQHGHRRRGPADLRPGRALDPVPRERSILNGWNVNPYPPELFAENFSGLGLPDVFKNKNPLRKTVLYR